VPPWRRARHPADATAIKISAANKAKGAPQFQHEIRGAGVVAETFKGKATAAQLALLNGSAGAAWAPNGVAVVAFRFSITGDRISAIEVVMDKATLRSLEIEIP
jgi:RNA polymerase sigma-70 factor (ECF subfamily)